MKDIEDIIATPIFEHFSLNKEKRVFSLENSAGQFSEVNFGLFESEIKKVAKVAMGYAEDEPEPSIMEKVRARIRNKYSKLMESANNINENSRESEDSLDRRSKSRGSSRRSSTGKRSKKGSKKSKRRRNSSEDSREDSRRDRSSRSPSEQHSENKNSPPKPSTTSLEENEGENIRYLNDKPILRIETFPKLFESVKTECLDLAYG